MKKFTCLVCAAVFCGVLLSGCGAAADTLHGALPEENTASTVTALPTPADAFPAPGAKTEPPAPAAEAPAADGPVRVDDPGVNDEYLSPFVTLRADPYLYKHEGTYYFTGSYPEYDRIELTSADSVNGIAAAVPKTVWKMDAQFKEKYVWAPEIHYVMDQWVIYFAYSQGSLWDIRCCALRCTGDDPMRDDWEYMGMIEAAEGDSFANNNGMALDMTVFYHDASDTWYAIWAQKPGSSNLYIAPLSDPFTLASEPILLTQPDYAWEKVNQSVNEGPAVMKHAGKIFVSFSAAGTGPEYCMGLLEIDACDDPMIIENWTKYPEPVFKTDETLKVYGPGHNCFVEGDNGEQLCILHFRDYSGIQGNDSLLDFNRHAHVMKVTFDKSGKPQFAFDENDLYNSQFKDHGT